MTKEGIKTDEEYGYIISLKDDRELKEGYYFGLNANDTDITALKKILDGYIDVSNVDTIEKFTQHKMEFSITFLDTICLILNEKIRVISTECTELETQEDDIRHLISKPYLTGQSVTTEEKIKIYDTYEGIVVKRRNVKDAVSILVVLRENLEKARNFILGMNQRYYSPKSERFKGNPEFRIGQRRMT